MILLPLMIGCIQQDNKTQFGVAPSGTEQNFEPEEDASALEDSSTEDTASQPDSSPFSVDSSIVCGNRTVGTEIGNCALNFALLNQNSEMVELHSFAGSVIFLDLSDFT